MAESKHIVCPHCDAVNRVADQRMADDPRCGVCHKALFVGRPVTLSEANFGKQTGRNDIPVVVDFWAQWCGPCKMMAPAFEAASAQLEPSVRLAKANTEEMQRVSAQLGIQSIPTLVLFKNGREVARQAGAMSQPQLVQWIQSRI